MCNSAPKKSFDGISFQMVNVENGAEKMAPKQYSYIWRRSCWWDTVAGSEWFIVIDMLMRLAIKGIGRNWAWKDEGIAMTSMLTIW